MSECKHRLERDNVPCISFDICVLCGATLDIDDLKDIYLMERERAEEAEARVKELEDALLDRYGPNIYVDMMKQEKEAPK